MPRIGGYYVNISTLGIPVRPVDLVVMAPSGANLIIDITTAAGRVSSKNNTIPLTAGVAYDAADLGIDDAQGARIFTDGLLYWDNSGDKDTEPSGASRIAAGSTFGVGAGS